MVRRQMQGIAMTDQDAVLAANLEFYRAFAARDLVAMEALGRQNMNLHHVIQGQGDEDPDGHLVGKR